ncbi:nuclear transport factor 2 family protein [Streptosporangium sp. NPDC051022]|uniref:nuclear transport factor 2 family protein n=1 Tax=Streptosporangium sp. NPDC051022 TaxID=3155752 RepID=UPI00342C8233
MTPKALGCLWAGATFGSGGPVRTRRDGADSYLAFFTEDAVLDDPSMGSQFRRHAGIKKYFDAYFIGYDTTTRLVSITPQEGGFHVVVDFTGSFPGGRTGGIFDITFAGDKFAFVQADLI